MAQGYLLREQLRQSRRAGEPIEAWGKFGAEAIGTISGHYKRKRKQKLLDAAEKRKAADVAYKESLRPKPDRARRENLGRWRSAVESKRFRAFSGGKEIDIAVGTPEEAGQVARYLGVDRDPYVLKWFKDQPTPAPTQAKDISPKPSETPWYKKITPRGIFRAGRAAAFAPGDFTGAYYGAKTLKRAYVPKTKIKDGLGLGGFNR